MGMRVTRFPAEILGPMFDIALLEDIHAYF
jgi:hypothetical protein